MKTILRGFAVLCLALPSAGCLVGGHSDVHQEGNYVSPETLSQISNGETKASWVRAVLGEPNEKIRVDEHDEIWRYAYSETKDSSGYVFLLFSNSDKKVTKSNVFVEFKDGVVTNRWRG